MNSLTGSEGGEDVGNVQVLWTLTDVARECSLSMSTVSAYRARGLMPEPDTQYGRTPLWRPETIMAWRKGQRRRVPKQEV